MGAAVFSGCQNTKEPATENVTKTEDKTTEEKNTEEKTTEEDTTEESGRTPAGRG